MIHKQIYTLFIHRTNKGSVLKKGDQDLIKNMNIAVILEKIRTDGPVSRASLSRMTGLSRSTCSILVDQLISEGLICETGKDESSGGRKAILLKMNYEGGRAIGLKLMKNRIAGALVDLSGRIIRIRSQEIFKGYNESELIEALIDVVQSLISFEEESTKGRIFGIGIGIGGKIDFHKGILIESSILSLKNIPIGPILEEKTGIPVFLENDVNAFTLGEKYFGEGKNFNNFLCVSLGSGIGAGVIINDVLYRGSHHLACEFGHMRIAENDSSKTCKCGKQGCLEAYASDGAIEEFFNTLSDRNASIDRIVELADEGDESALKSFSMAGAYLGYGISTLINLFDPETLLIGGEGIVYYKYMEEEVNKALRKNVVYGLFNEIVITPVSYDDNLWVRGVATLVVREVFKRKI